MDWMYNRHRRHNSMIIAKLDRPIDWFVDSQRTCHNAEQDTVPLASYF
jgi:hypothetical protein